MSSGNSSKAATAFYGTAIYAGTALVVSILLMLYVGTQTKDRTQVDTNRS